MHLKTWRGMAGTGLRVLSWIGLGALAYDIGKSVKEKVAPSEETRLRSNMEALFSDDMTYEAFKAKLDQYPDLRTDIRKLWWFMNKNGLVKKIEEYSRHH